MNDEGYSEFKSKIPDRTRIAFEASGLAYVVFVRGQSSVLDNHI